MEPVPSKLVAVGPWFVDARLDSAAASAGTPYLCLEGTAAWVAEKWRRWQGSREEAEELALTYGGVAVPREWVAAEEAAKRAHILPGPGRTGIAATGKARPHRHDRTGEEIEP